MLIATIYNYLPYIYTRSITPQKQKTKMNTRTKNLIYALLTMLLAVLLGLTCNAQTTSTGEDCGCAGKASRHLFSCYPDCDFTKIETITVPGSGNELIAIRPRQGYAMDVKLYFSEGGRTDSITYLNTAAINFNDEVCGLYFANEWQSVVKGFESIVVINHKYGPHPSIYPIVGPK